MRIVLAALIVLPLVPAAARAQSAAAPETQLRLEQRRVRLMVRPEVSTATAARDAEQAAGQAAAAEITREANDPVRRQPQLDYDVTSAVQARTIQRSLRR